MPLQEIYYIAEMIVGVAVIISIVFVAIELRQNTYVTRKSMADGREQRLNWLMEQLATNEDFRDFYYQIEFEEAFDKLDKKERHRAVAIGIRLSRPMLNELVAYHDGQISSDEFNALEVNIRRAKNRAFINAAYEYTKAGFSKKVQDHWESLQTVDVYRPNL